MIFLPPKASYLAKNGKDHIISKREDLVGDAQAPVNVVYQQQLAQKNNVEGRGAAAALLSRKRPAVK